MNFSQRGKGSQCQGELFPANKFCSGKASGQKRQKDDFKNARPVS